MEGIAPGPGPQDAGLAWILFDLLAQAVDHIFEQHMVPVAVAAPDGLDDLIGHEDVSRAAHQQV